MSQISMNGRFQPAETSRNGWKCASKVRIAPCLHYQHCLSDGGLFIRWERPLRPMGRREQATQLLAVRYSSSIANRHASGVLSNPASSSTCEEVARARLSTSFDLKRRPPAARALPGRNGGRERLPSVDQPRRGRLSRRQLASPTFRHRPRHFLGREDALARSRRRSNATNGPVAITALHGLRGVGKTTLAAAYAERHRSDYRATWWIRAQTATTMRADLAALGVRLGWVAADEKEELALEVGSRAAAR